MSNLSTLPSFTEDEIDQLNDLYMSYGLANGRREALNFLIDTLELSKVHEIVIELRKELNAKDSLMWNEYNNKYENSTLDAKLMQRLDFVKNEITEII